MATNSRHSKKKEKMIETTRKFPVGLPYIKGVSNQLQRVFRQHGVPSFNKPFNTIRSQLVALKDKSELEYQCGVIYSMSCRACEKE